MITLQEAMQNIGRKVVYTPYRGDIEEGVITGTSSVWVFVRFGDAKHSKATAGAALEFADGDS